LIFSGGGFLLNYEITVEVAHPLTLAAVRSTVPASGIATAWKPALDKVWAFLRMNHILNSGQNVFFYHHPERSGDAMNIDFGVQVSYRFDDVGDVMCVETPSGEVAQAVHIGPYDRLREAHTAIHRWCEANKRPIASSSWEIYGHWNDDPEKLVTTIRYLLA
jgi:effector-binding domain-containing protein